MKEGVNKAKRVVSKITGSTFLIIIAVVLVLSSYTIIPGGYQGVIFSKISGIQDVTLGEGFHFKKPFIDQIVKIEVRTKKIEENTVSTSQDQQIVQTTYALNYRVNKDQASKLYQEIGLDYENRIIVPALKGAIKTVMAQYVAADLIQKRDEVSIKIEELIRDKLKDQYLSVERFELTEIDFSDTYDLAIEAKVQAEQEALKAKNELERIKIEAEQKIVRAEADKAQRILEAEANAEAIELEANAQAKAIAVINVQLQSSPDYLEYKRIDKWNGILPNVVAGDGDVLLTVSGEQSSN